MTGWPFGAKLVLVNRMPSSVAFYFFIAALSILQLPAWASWEVKFDESSDSPAKPPHFCDPAIWHHDRVKERGQRIVNAVCGNGRGDGKERLYAYLAPSHTVVEMENSVEGPHAVKDLFGANPFPSAIAIGPGKSGRPAIFAAIGIRLWEFSWTGSEWKRELVDGMHNSIALALFSADLRRDGIVRLYAAGNDRIIEYTASSTSWRKKGIPLTVTKFTSVRLAPDNSIAVVDFKGVHAKVAWDGPTGLRLGRVDGADQKLREAISIAFADAGCPLSKGSGTPEYTIVGLFGLIRGQSVLGLSLSQTPTRQSVAAAEVAWTRPGDRASALQQLARQLCEAEANPRPVAKTAGGMKWSSYLINTFPHKIGRASVGVVDGGPAIVFQAQETIAALRLTPAGWEIERIAISSKGITGVSACDARGDGKSRIYVVFAHDPAIMELTRHGNDWRGAMFDPGVKGVPSDARLAVASDVRCLPAEGGKSRLYIDRFAFRDTMECSWLRRWDCKTGIGLPPAAVGTSQQQAALGALQGQVWSKTIGPTNKNLYVTAFNSKLYEIGSGSDDGKDFVISEFQHYPYLVVAGDLAGEGRDRVYVFESEGPGFDSISARLWEFTPYQELETIAIIPPQIDGASNDLLAQIIHAKFSSRPRFRILPKQLAESATQKRRCSDDACYNLLVKDLRVDAVIVTRIDLSTAPARVAMSRYNGKTVPPHTITASLRTSDAMLEGISYGASFWADGNHKRQ